MDVDYDDQKLALVETDQAAATDLPVAIIQAVRTAVNILRAAPDEQTLNNWVSLGFQRSDGRNQANAFVSIAEVWRLWLRVDLSCQPHRLTVVEVVRVN